ncbi:MAG TPA: SDR family oxidoreductase [Dermatophilaceae bacterium]|nr:SDR family oxidoreductase [Dermatophilaceae bacterium]
MTRVLVSGGSGFIGSSVVARLAAADDVDLVVSGDLRTPAKPADGPERVIHARLDVTDPESIARALVDHHIDTVVHLAAIVDPDPAMSREAIRRVDVEGTRNVLEACVAARVCQLVVSSSGAAYGYRADNPVPLREDHPLRGNDEFAYSQHKRLVEELLARYRRQHPALAQTVLRIGTVLGERVDNQITALFERRRLLKIRGSDSPFVFIWDADLVEIITLAVRERRKGIYNVAGDGALTVDEIAAVLGRPLLVVPAAVLRAALTVGRRLRVTAYGPEQTTFLQYRPVLDNTRLKTEFGYIPTRTSREAFEAWVESLRRR